MIKDRYGQPLFPENSITVFDTSLNYDSELFEDTVGLKLKDFDKLVYSNAFEVDVGAGADWPAVVYEVLNSAIPWAVVATVFFSGERVERNLAAWKRMASSLLSLIPKRGFTGANGAALLALDAVFEATDAEQVELVAYTWVDPEMEFFDASDQAKAAFDLIAAMDKIQPRDQQFGVGLHSMPVSLFKFQADGKEVLAKVSGGSVEVSN
ncbi:MAG: hypothetical protein QNJ03_07030 [Dinoroseobacter sp.]|nr:hypothetical protein [Dinoroseobacter sp.]